MCFAVATLAVGPFLSSVLRLSESLYLVPVVLLVLAVAIRAMEGRFEIPGEVLIGVTSIVAFLCWMMTTGLWSSTGVEFSDDLLRLASLLVLVVLTGLTFDWRSAGAVGAWLMVMSLVVASYVFWSYLRAGTLSGFGPLSGHYLVVAQAIGIGAVLAVLRSLTACRRVISIPVAFILLTALALSLARGALIAVILIMAISGLYVAFERQGRYRPLGAWIFAQVRRVTVLAIVAGGIVAVGLAAFQVERTRTRFLRLFTGGELTEGARAELWRQAWASIGDAPLVGHGLGSSGVMSGTTIDLYPHNWLLQVWLDGGIIGVMLCLIAVAFPLVSIIRRPDRDRREKASRWLPLLGAYFFLLLEYSKSSDFYTARVLFVVGILVVHSVVGPPPRQTLAPKSG